MSYISITLGGVSINGGSYLTTSQTIGITDKFNVKFTVKNTESNRSIRYMSVRYDWMYNNTIVGSKYVKGTALSGKSTTYGASIDKIDEGKSSTFTLPNNSSSNGISASAMGMTATSKANKLRINVAGWISSESGGPHFSGYYDITNVAYQGETHNPTIINFSVKRVSNESNQLTITGYGTHTLPSNPQFSDTLVFQYSTNNGSSWTTDNSLFTLEELLANTTKTWDTSTFSLSTTTRAIFKITFGNNYETKAIATSSVNTSKAVIHLYGTTTGGVGLGRYCSASNRFECNYPAYFYNNIYDKNGNRISGHTYNLSLGEIQTSDLWEWEGDDSKSYSSIIYERTFKYHLSGTNREGTIISDFNTDYTILEITGTFYAYDSDSQTYKWTWPISCYMSSSSYVCVYREASSLKIKASNAGYARFTIKYRH